MEAFMSDEKIAALVDRAKVKDKEAITALIHEVHPQVCRRLSYCDIAQEDLRETSRKVYVRAFQNLNTLDNPEDFRHWILQIAEAEAAEKKKEYPPMDQPAVTENAEELPSEEQPVVIHREEKSFLPVLPIFLAAAAVVLFIAIFVGMKVFSGNKAVPAALLRDEPSETVADMERALNHLDEEAIVSCFDKAAREKYQGQADPQVHEWISTIGSFLKMTGSAPKFALEVLNVDYKDDEHCDVKVKLNYTWFGMEDSEEINVPMVLEGKHWYINTDGLSEQFDSDDIFGSDEFEDLF